MNHKLKEISTENYIWIIYIFIIIASWYSKRIKKKYFLTNNKIYKDKYNQILTNIFTILLFIYFYFFKSSIESINSLKINDNIKKKNLTYLSSLSSFLIVISGIIYLYIAITDENIDVEIAFN